MSKFIKINDKWKVRIDSYNNHEPFEYQEGGEVIEKGKYIGRLTKEKWVTHQKYFKNMNGAVEYIVQQDFLNRGVSEISVAEYVQRLDDIKDEILSATFVVENDSET